MLTTVLIACAQTMGIAHAHIPSFCGDNTLQVNFLDGISSHGRHQRNAQITGTIDTPAPGYNYSLIFIPSLADGVYRGVLTIVDERPNMVRAAVITPMKIAQNFDVPIQTSRIEVKVVKKFEWGPFMYAADINKKYTICLEPHDQTVQKELLPEKE